MIVQHFFANNCSCHCSDTLLPVNQNLFADGHRSVFKLYVRILPYNDIAYRKAFVK